MFRFFVLLCASVAAVVWIDPAWSRSDRSLSLRLRSTPEIVAFVRAKARELGGEAVSTIASGNGKQPSVAAAPPARDPEDELTAEDRERLDRLIAEKTRDRR